MPDMNDFYAFKSTSGGDGGASGGGGCSGSTFTWVMLIISLLWLIGKCSG